MATASTEQPTDQEIVEAFIVRGREEAAPFSALMMAAGGDEVAPHPMFDLMLQVLEACRADKKHCVIITPPEHGKSTEIRNWLLHELGHNPAIRIGLISADLDNAKRNLLKMRKTILSDVFRATFPDIIPDTQASTDKGEWSTTRLYLKGQHWPAIEVFPLDGSAEGVRLDLVWLDDAEPRKCQHHEAERERVRSAIHGTWLRRCTAGGMVIISNNVWHPDGPTQKMRESSSFCALTIGYNDVDRIFWKLEHPPVSWQGETAGHFELWDPWPRHRLESTQAEDEYTFRRMFGCVATVAGLSRFPELAQWGRYRDLPEPKSYHRIYGALDPSGGRGAEDEDYAAVWLILELEAESLIIDGCVARLLPADQVAKCYALHRKWQRLGYGDGIYRLKFEVLKKDEGWIWGEWRAQQAALREAGDKSWKLPIEPHYPVENKESRIERLARPFSMGWLRVPADAEALIADDKSEFGRALRILTKQLQDFPHADHDDAPDALIATLDNAKAGGPGRPLSEEERIERRLEESRAAEIANQLSRFKILGRHTENPEAEAWGLDE